MCYFRSEVTVGFEPGDGGHFALMHSAIEKCENGNSVSFGSSGSMPLVENEGFDIAYLFTA